MKYETKFNVGDTVYFLSDDTLYKGVINEITINVRKCILIIYEVAFINRDNEESTKDMGEDWLFESAKDLVEKLMLDFENSEKENEETAKKEI